MAFFFCFWKVVYYNHPKTRDQGDSLGIPKLNTDTRPATQNKRGHNKPRHKNQKLTVV